MVEEDLYSSRHKFYIYVNEESLKSVVNPVRAEEKTGNFLVLVSTDYNVHSQTFEEDKDLYTEVDAGNWSFKLIPATDLLKFYAQEAEDSNLWNIEPINQFPPFIQHKHYGWRPLKFLENHDPVGYDCYKMLKQIYGKANARSRFFEADEATSDAQKIMGFDYVDVEFM